MKIGLKFWSTNDHYIPLIYKLKEQCSFDFIELFAVPESFESYGKLWKDLDLKYTIHAPHWLFEFNLARSEYEKNNISCFKETKKFADLLESDSIVVHGGVEGTVETTDHQLRLLNDSRIILENMPVKGLKGHNCVGSTVEQVEKLMPAVHGRFCLDISHAVCSANSLHQDPYAYIRKYNQFKPVMYHLSGMSTDSFIDKHLHFWEGDLDIDSVMNAIPFDASIVIETRKESEKNLDDLIRDYHHLNRYISSHRKEN